MRLTYVGGPAGLHTLAAALRSEGIEVEFEPPMEERGAGDTVVTVVLTIAADRAIGPLFETAYSKALAVLKQRFPRASVSRSDD